MSTKKLHDLNIIDSPGLNDSSLSDVEINLMIVNSIKDLVSSDQGFSGLIQVVALDNSGRVKAQSIEYMLNLLRSLTYSHSDFLQLNDSFPRVNVMLTKMSREQQAQFNKFSGDQEVMVLDQFINEYRKQLIKRLWETCNPMVHETFYEELVDKILPKENFYCY